MVAKGHAALDAVLLLGLCLVDSRVEYFWSSGCLSAIEW